MTAAQLLGLRGSENGGLVGRVMSEALPNGIVPKAFKAVEKSKKKSENGLETVLNVQRVGSQRYFDAAGFVGRTLGLEPDAGKQKTAGK
jgi:hypothetical protein